MKLRYTLPLLLFLPLAACDRDTPEEEMLEQAEETLEEMPDPVPVPVPVPVDTTLPRTDTMGADTMAADTIG